jgi:Xaa-Pro aminopeptidase
MSFFISPSCRQSFSDTAEPQKAGERLARLREVLKKQQVDGFLVPHADAHQSEYLAEREQRLAWLTGFSGSAGACLVLEERALLFVDGRYTLQARQTLDLTVLDIVASHETSLRRWLEQEAPEGLCLGFDPWLCTCQQQESWQKALAARHGSLKALSSNPIDELWHDRPKAPDSSARAHPLAFAGEEASAKWERIRERLNGNFIGNFNEQALLVSDPHNLAWAFNLRGADVPHNPVVLAYGLITPKGKPVLFLARERLDASLCEALGEEVEIRDPAQLCPSLIAMAQQTTIRLDTDSGAFALHEAITGAAGRVAMQEDPITALKAVKNSTEIAGARVAHRRDGAALARFLFWFEKESAKHSLTEIDAVLALESFRRESPAFRDLSFTTIAGAGSNGAIVHYRVTEASNRTLSAETLFLIDSGAQYEDGTTDVTRTLSTGTPSAAMRRDYTLVLKGHIALSRTLFPKGTSGAALDTLARYPLWQEGLDYDHGTGHGVGSYLSVHEGPQRIAKSGGTALEPGMILSNEPGLYREGRYGIRIENLVLVQSRAVEGAQKPMLGFETLTLVPYARSLIETTLLSSQEKDWIDAYHARVFQEIRPLVEVQVRAFLEEATRPLDAS